MCNKWICMYIVYRNLRIFNSECHCREPYKFNTNIKKIFEQNIERENVYIKHPFNRTRSYNDKHIAITKISLISINNFHYSEWLSIFVIYQTFTTIITDKKRKPFNTTEITIKATHYPTNGLEFKSMALLKNYPKIKIIVNALNTFSYHEKTCPFEKGHVK